MVAAWRFMAAASEAAVSRSTVAAIVYGGFHGYHYGGYRYAFHRHHFHWRLYLRAVLLLLSYRYCRMILTYYGPHGSAVAVTITGITAGITIAIGET